MFEVLHSLTQLKSRGVAFEPQRDAEVPNDLVESLPFSVPTSLHDPSSQATFPNSSLSQMVAKQLLAT